MLFISTHQTGLFPGTGKIREAGKGDGEGYTINLPLPGAALSCAPGSSGPCLLQLAICGNIKGAQHWLSAFTLGAILPSARCCANLNGWAYLLGSLATAAYLLPIQGMPGAHADQQLACAGDSGDAAMLATFDELVEPAARRFQPDIILVRSMCTCTGALKLVRSLVWMPL